MNLCTRICTCILLYPRPRCQLSGIDRQCTLAQVAALLCQKSPQLLLQLGQITSREGEQSTSDFSRASEVKRSSLPTKPNLQCYSFYGVC